MNISEMNLSEVVERLAQLDTEVREMTEVEAVEKATEEKKALLERKAELDAVEERKAQAEAIQHEEVKVEVVEERTTVFEKENEEMITRDSAEYRSAFYANLFGQATPEQRAAIAADNSAYGDGVAIPTSLDTMIWDQIAEAHPILNDVQVVKSGMVLKVTQSTPDYTNAGKKKDSAATTDITFTMVDKNLVGKDYHAVVSLTYAEAKMSQGVLESYLATAVADAIGDNLAKDVFAEIKTEAVANQVTAGADIFADIKSALGKATQAAKPVIYAPSSKYYEIVGAIKSGSPFNIGTTLGCEVKLDNATADVVVLDPKMFVLNVAADMLVESAKNIKAAEFDVSGYMRAEGCLRKINAAAFIA